MSCAYTFDHPILGKWHFKHPHFMIFETDGVNFYVRAYRDVDPNYRLYSKDKTCCPKLLFECEAFSDGGHMSWYDFEQELSIVATPEMIREIVAEWNNVARTGRIFRTSLNFEIDADDLEFDYELCEA